MSNIVYTEASKSMDAKHMTDISVARLHELFLYDKESGLIRWRVRPSKNSRARIGGIAGCVKTNGYRYLNVDGREVTAAQVAWSMSHGELPIGRVTTVNDDPSDLRTENLMQQHTVDGDFDHTTSEGRAAYYRAHRAAHPEHYKNIDLQKKYAIDFAEYQRKFVEQKGVCAICSSPETAKRGGKVKWLAVDHDHETGVVRDLLCEFCNKAIGFMRERPESLRTAASYLERHASQNGNVVALHAKKVN